MKTSLSVTTMSLTVMPLADVPTFDGISSQYKVNKVEIKPHWAFPVAQWKTTSVCEDK